MKKIVQSFFILTIVIGGLLLVPVPAQADGCASIDQSLQHYGAELPNLPRYCTIGPVIRRVLNIAFSVIGMVALIFFMIGGFRYMTAGGNEEQATAGKKTALYAIMGLVVVILAVTIVNVIVNLLLYGRLA